MLVSGSGPALASSEMAFLALAGDLEKARPRNLDRLHTTANSLILDAALLMSGARAQRFLKVPSQFQQPH